MQRKPSIGPFLVALAIAGGRLLEAQDIVSFHGNGFMTWTNGDTNLFYRVEWAPALTGSNSWRSVYSELLDIRSPNPSVTSAVPIFYRVSASSNRLVHAAPVAKTGAGDLAGYTEVPGEDGYGTMRKGVAWPSPRFTDNRNGTVTDNLTGLVWLKNANAFGSRAWADALTDCATLNSGEKGLTDGSVEGDWRLPNVHELQSLIDYGRFNPSLCNTAGTGPWTSGDPFTNVQSSYYWSGTTYVSAPSYAWYVAVYDGVVSGFVKTLPYYVWPVRGGP